MKVLSKRQISLINHLTQESGWPPPGRQKYSIFQSVRSDEMLKLLTFISLIKVILYSVNPVWA